MQPADWLAFVRDLADRTDPIALEFFRSVDLHVETKPDRTPVTEADRRIEQVARAFVRERAPQLGVLGEEFGDQGNADRLIIDPIDGTRNFVRGIPVFATLLAIEINGELIASAVSAPAMQARWSAARGCGAWQGEHRISVSGVKELAAAQLFHGSLAGDEAGNSGDIIMRLARATQRQRGFGDFYQHVLVACGAGEIAFDPGLQPWDIAALVPLVEEAGGRITGTDGERSIHAGTFLSSNGVLHEAALELVAA
jgi:histidinol-phosphatase